MIRYYLVLLILGDEIVHVGLGLSELHLIHALASVPMEESLAAEHSSELLGNALEDLLDSGRISDESGSHLESPGWNVAHGRLHVVRDPFHEVGRILVLHVQHLLINFLHRHAATEDGGNSQVPTVTRIASSHHVFGVEHLFKNIHIINHNEACIINFMSHTCWVSSGTERARYCWEPRAVSGANPGMKKWRRGKGTMLTASLRKSAFNWPGKRRQVVTPDMVTFK